VKILLRIDNQLVAFREPASFGMLLEEIPFNDGQVKAYAPGRKTACVAYVDPDGQPVRAQYARGEWFAVEPEVIEFRAWDQLGPEMWV
jgi:hypothetical protein